MENVETSDSKYASLSFALPAAEEAERAIIKLALSSKHDLNEAIYALEPHYFFKPQHARIWRAITEVAQSAAGMKAQSNGVVEDADITPAMVVDHMPSETDARFLQGVLSAGMPNERIEPNLEALKRTYAHRKAIEEVEASVFSFAQNGNFSELDVLSAEIAAIAAKGELEDETYGMANPALTQELNERIIRRKGVRGVSLGLPRLDRVIGGISKRKVHVVAGYSGSGKSTLVWQAGVNLALNGQKVLFFPTEMDPAEYVERTICAWAALSHEAYMLGEYSDNQANDLLIQKQKLEELPLMFYAPRVPSVEGLKHAVKKHKPDVVIVDYIQDVEAAGKFRDRFEMINYVSREIAHLKNLDIAVILAAQINREGVKDPSRPPEIFHLRDSARIEHDSDVIMIVHRPGMWEKNENEPLGKFEVHAKKVRSMRPGYVELYQPDGKYWLTEPLGSPVSYQ